MYRTAIILLFYLSLASCSSQSQKPIDNEQLAATTKDEVKHIVAEKIQTVLDQNLLSGNVLIWHANENSFYSNNFDLSSVGHLPASTYKIPHTLIGLETGIVHKDHIFKWDGSQRNLAIWERDLVLKDAFQRSCVPCFQEMASMIGTENMLSKLEKLNFGNMVVTEETLNNFWLVGDSKITPYEQLDFLNRLYKNQLPISEGSISTMKDFLLLEENSEYILSGKTGWSIVEDDHRGWFVGYLEKGKEIYFFATLIEPAKDFDMNNFPVIRKQVTIETMQALEII